MILGRLSGHEGDGTEICDNGRDVAPIPLVPVPRVKPNPLFIPTLIQAHTLSAPTAPSPLAVEGWGGVSNPAHQVTNLYPQVRSRHRPGKQQPIQVLRLGYFFVILGRLSGHEGDGTEICDNGRDVAPIPLVPVPRVKPNPLFIPTLWVKVSHQVSRGYVGIFWGGGRAICRPGLASPPSRKSLPKNAGCRPQPSVKAVSHHISSNSARWYTRRARPPTPPVRHDSVRDPLRTAARARRASAYGPD